MYTLTFISLILICFLNLAWWLAIRRSLLRRVKRAEAQRDVERAYTTKVQAHIDQIVATSEELMANNGRLTDLARQKDEVYDKVMSIMDQALAQLADQQPMIEHYNELVQLRQRLSEN